MQLRQTQQHTHAPPNEQLRADLHIHKLDKESHMYMNISEALQCCKQPVRQKIILATCTCMLRDKYECCNTRLPFLPQSLLHSLWPLSLLYVELTFFILLQSDFYYSYIPCRYIYTYTGTLESDRPVSKRKVVELYYLTPVCCIIYRHTYLPDC